DSLQRHLEELSPRLPVLRNLPHLEPPTFLVEFGRVADIAELRDLHSIHQLPLRDLGLGVLVMAPAGERLEPVALGLIVVAQQAEGVMHDDLLPLVAGLAEVSALDGEQKPVELALDDLGPLESPPLAGGEPHPALALPLADEEVELLHRVPLGGGAS